MELPRRILFVGAHCDDIELMAGGLLAHACRSKREVGVLVLSDHRGVVDEATAMRARAELASNLGWLAEQTRVRVVDHSGLWLPACQGAFESRRGEIYAALEHVRDRYDLVVTHASTDTNQDHVQVATEARRVFKAHATVLAGEFPSNDVGGFRPQVYVKLTEEDVAAKVRLVERYESQIGSGRAYLGGDVIRALARVRGSQIGENAAEAFDVLTRIVVRS